MALQCPASTSCNPTDKNTRIRLCQVLTFQFCTPCVPSVDMAPEPEPEGFGCCCNDCAPGELVEPASKGRDSAEALEQATDPIPSQTTYLYISRTCGTCTLSTKLPQKLPQFWTPQQLAIWSVWTLLASHLLPIPPQVEQHIIYASNASNASGLWKCTLFHRCIIPSASAFSKLSVSKWMPKHDQTWYKQIQTLPNKNSTENPIPKPSPCQPHSRDVVTGGRRLSGWSSECRWRCDGSFARRWSFRRIRSGARAVGMIKTYQDFVLKSLKWA